MPSRNLLRAFVALWWTLGIAILVMSAMTLREMIRAGAYADRHVALLATVEGMASIAFLVPRTLRVGATVLLGVLVVAIVLHGVRGHVRWDLLIDAAGVLFVSVHGPLTRDQWALVLRRAA